MPLSVLACQTSSLSKRVRLSHLLLRGHAALLQGRARQDWQTFC